MRKEDIEIWINLWDKGPEIKFLQVAPKVNGRPLSFYDRKHQNNKYLHYVLQQPEVHKPICTNWRACTCWSGGRTVMWPSSSIVTPSRGLGGRRRPTTWHCNTNWVTWFPYSSLNIIQELVVGSARVRHRSVCCCLIIPHLTHSSGCPFPRHLPHCPSRVYKRTGHPETSHS
jgi:hypothetical protein